jgi:diguanylate cyclase (GGDEF)-like protein
MDETMLLHRILAALAVGEPLGEVLRLVTEMVAVPPLAIEGAALYDPSDGRFGSAAASGIGPAARLAIDTDDPELPWSAARVLAVDRADAPALVLVDDLPATVRGPLRDAGYLECWTSPVVLDGDRVVGALVALTLETTLPGATMRQRMRRARDVAELAFVRRDHEDQLRHAALHDGLTKIPNRTRFFDALEHGVGQRGGPQTGVAYLDLDGFKPLNDTHGHPFGDRVLVEVAHRIDGALRPHDLAARLGGDEFAVLLEDLHSPDEAAQVARRLLDVVQAPMVIDGVTATVGVSIGLAVGPSGGDRSALLNDADQAMYEAKRAGRGSLRIVTA